MEEWNSHTLLVVHVKWWNVKWWNCFGKQFAFSQKIKHRVIIWPNNVTPRETRAPIHIKTCTWMLIATLFIIAPKCNNPNVHYPINKKVYTYNEILLNQNSSEVLIQAMTWVNLENIVLSKTSQSQRPHMLLFHWH